MALIENRSSDPMDPLQHRSLLSMFHRTFKDAPIVNDSNDLDSIHSFLKTMDTKSTNKLFGEAKEIVEVNSELSGSKLAPLGVGASENNDEAVSKCNENPKERRPAMGRKRARFSLKPDKGPPSVSLEPSLDIDQLQDPEEFFSAYHKLEYAKREMERQTGGNISAENDCNAAAYQRGRRPSMFRKSVSYKHNYSSAILEDNDTLIASQETTQQDNLSPSKFVSQQPSDPNVELQKKDLAGSVSNSEDTAGGLLDELLSTNIENLDGDGALSLLQSRLQIKPVDLDKYLHDFSEGGNVDSMDLEEEVPAIRKKPLSDIQNLMNGLSETNHGNSKIVTENQNHSLTVATPPEKPLAASSLLEKANSVSKPCHHAFSAADLDMSPAGSPTFEYLNRQSDNLSTRDEPDIPGKSKSCGDDEAKSPACPTMGSKQMMPGVNCSKKSSSFDTSSIHIETITKESHDGLMETIEGTHVSDSARLMAATVVQTQSMSEAEKNVVDIPLGASSTHPDASVNKSTTENVKLSESQLGQEEPIVAEDQVIGGHTTNAESSLKQQKKEHPRISPKDKKKESRARGLKERKALSRRQSLAAAGTRWDAGVRRSNRIRVRPLEYWKGERFLYGRVHETLTTVVGVKCISSPSPGAKEPKFRVTSYVTDEHKDVVEFAALH